MNVHGLQCNPQINPYSRGPRPRKIIEKEKREKAWLKRKGYGLPDIGRVMLHELIGGRWEYMENGAVQSVYLRCTNGKISYRTRLDRPWTGCLDMFDRAKMYPAY